MSETAITNQSQNPLPLLLTDGFFLFPKCNYSLDLTGENEKLKPVLLRAWKEHQGRLIILSSKDKLTDLAPPLDNLNGFYSVGTLGRIVLTLTYQANAESIINSLREIQLEGWERVEVLNPQLTKNFWKAEYQILPEPEQNRNEKFLSKLTEKFIAYLPRILKKANLDFSEKFHYLAMSNLGNFIDFLAQINSEISRSNKQTILATVNLSQRLDCLLEISSQEKTNNQNQKIEKDIKHRVESEEQKESRSYRLRKIISEAQKELRKLEGSEGESWEEKYLARLEKEPFPEKVKTVVREQINQFKTIPPHFGEANIIRNYVDLLMSLPWWETTPENQNLDQARQVLDQEHFGLEKIKELIIEYLAVVKRTKSSLGRILCLVGPPGTGKTSLAKSIAEATGRKFEKISLGGLGNGREISGDRVVYLNSEPGQIVQAIKRAKVINPVILLDEIDKMGIKKGHPEGDASSALLAVLDPEQNTSFVDHHLEIPLDLSRVFFICTANDSTNIPAPLRDRMQIIRLSSYTEIEKLAIAINHLIPRSLKKYKLDSSELSLSSKAIRNIIRHYSRGKAGVRDTERSIQKIFGKVVLELTKEEVSRPIRITPAKLHHYLGKPVYDFTLKEEKPRVGLVQGLAWTSAGGDILQIQIACSFERDKKGKLTKPTGQLGEVMKESVEVAFKYLKVNCEKFGIDQSTFKASDINVHLPEGAIPKEGPSAGIALTTAMISALTKQAVPTEIGMTGEIDLLGNVLAIGGLREKSIAAHRSGLKTIFIPQKNQKDLEDIPPEVRKNLKIILVSDYEQVWENIFSSEGKFSPLPKANASSPLSA